MTAFGPTVRSYSVRQLLRLCEQGKFAVPKLQRAFVWNGKKAALLVDSVFRGLPIGSLTVWETKRANYGLLPNSHHILPEFNEANERVWFLLDGQQRLSVLYNVIQGRARLTSRRQIVNFGWVVLSLEHGRKREEPNVDYRRPVAGKWHPMSYVLGSHWHSRAKDLSGRKQERIREARVRMFSTRLPIVQVGTGDIDEARRLFIRINSLGTKLAAADQAFARASRLDLRALAYSAWDALPKEFQGLSYEMLLQALALVEEIKEVGEKAYTQVVSRWEREAASEQGRRKFAKHWKRFVAALRGALDDLRGHYGVVAGSILPSQYMVAMLTVFYFHHRGRAKLTQRKAIDRWFWSTTLAQRYSGRGFRPHLIEDAGFFRKLATGRRSQFRMVERVDPGDLRRASYGRRSSIADAVYCLLLRQGPRDLLTGEDVQFGGDISPASAQHRHHVFPRHQLRNQDLSETKVNSVCNICLVAGGTNSEIGAQQPKAYLGRHGGRTRDRILRANLLPTGADNPLLHGRLPRSFDRFLSARLKILTRAFEEAAGAVLFARSR